MNLTFNILNDNSAYEAYELAKNWDENDEWCTNKKECFAEYSLFCNMYGLYDDSELIGLGTISYFPSFISNESNNETKISYIINPRYRRMGIGTKLVNYLINVSSKRYEATKVNVEILKSNMASITLIENNCFDFVSFNDKTIIYEKKL